jgi:hypothetical protein
MLNDRVDIRRDDWPAGEIQRRTEVINFRLIKRYARKLRLFATSTHDMIRKSAVLGQVRCSDAAFLISPEVVGSGDNIHVIILRQRQLFS